MACSQSFSVQGRARHSSSVTRRERARSAAKMRSCAPAKPASSTFRFASSLTAKERWSKLVEPTETHRPSAISTLQWYIVGWYS